MTAFPSGARNIDTLPEGSIRYSFCTLVTKPGQYADMVDSFRARGFDGPDCEFLYADNSAGNGYDGYQGLNRMIHKAQGTYVIAIHQDILAVDDRARLDTALSELDAKDPNWAVAGNAGSTAKGKAARRMTSSMGYDERVGTLPARVETLDENFLVLKRAANLGPSHDLSGFHMYGTDLVQQAAFRGHTAYVIDFHLEHLGLTEIDDGFIAGVDAFRAKYKRALKSKLLATAVTHVGFGRDFLKSIRHRARLGHQARGTKPALELKAIKQKLSTFKYHRRDDACGARYTLDGTTFQLPKRAPVAALRAIHAGSYEKPERELSRKYLAPDLPVIELGGSFGIVSHLIRSHLNADTHLAIVEANPKLIDTCKGNVGKAGMDNTHVINAALAYDTDTVRFTVTDGLHDSHVSTDAREDAGQEIEVPALTLESLLKDEGITGDFSLVCDIEGAEWDLFVKDREALKRCAVAVVEFHPDPFVRQGDSTSAFFRNVREAGFDIVETQANVLVAKRRDTTA